VHKPKPKLCRKGKVIQITNGSNVNKHLNSKITSTENGLNQINKLGELEMESKTINFYVLGTFKSLHIFIQSSDKKSFLFFCCFFLNYTGSCYVVQDSTELLG
jgi:hypothetical protein